MEINVSDDLGELLINLAYYCNFVSTMILAKRPQTFQTCRTRVPIYNIDLNSMTGNFPYVLLSVDKS